MKLFYFSTSDDKYIKLLEYFRKNIESQNLDKREFIYRDYSNGLFRGGGYQGWKNRYQTICKALNELKNDEYFIASDTDIRFYKDLDKEISNLISKYPTVDFFLQKESLSVGINIGFMIIKKTTNIQNFFNTANSIISSNTFNDKNGVTRIRHENRAHENHLGAGQDWIETILYKDSTKDEHNWHIWHNNTYDILWMRLPNNYWHIPLEDISSEDIILHHATGVGDIYGKLKQLKYL
jgi:hypothetical protein